MTHDSHWQERWQTDRTSWDLGEAHPYCGELLKLSKEAGGLSRGARFWVPGCGRAHEARYLVEQGYPSVGEDIVPKAIEAAKAAGVPPGLTLIVGDVFKVRALDKSSFDGVFDRAMLCALSPHDREAYRDSCHSRLKPGGLFMAILFTEVLGPDGPPFAVSVADLLESWGEFFSLVATLEREVPYKKIKIVSEALVVLRKRI
jgi:SAM-dependent methyltransferase